MIYYLLQKWRCCFFLAVYCSMHSYVQICELNTRDVQAKWSFWTYLQGHVFDPTERFWDSVVKAYTRLKTFPHESHLTSQAMTGDGSYSGMLQFFLFCYFAKATKLTAWHNMAEAPLTETLLQCTHFKSTPVFNGKKIYITVAF